MAALRGMAQPHLRELEGARAALGSAMVQVTTVRVGGDDVKKSVTRGFLARAGKVNE